MSDASQKNSADYSPAPTPPQALEIPQDYAGMRFDAALARLYPEHSRSRLQEWLKAGLIQLDGAAAEGKSRVLGGEHIVFAADMGGILQTHDHAAEDIALNIVFEDDALLVINKPAGLVVHPGNGNASGTLLNALLHHAPQLAGIPRAGIVHRLDKDTSGLLVVAKTLTAQTSLVRQLQARTVKRHYLALVLGVIDLGGTIDAPLGRHPVHRTKMAVVRSGGREAKTHYLVRERFAKATLLECRLETGRTHQIRVHLAHAGHPIAGDDKYGDFELNRQLSRVGFKRMFLHAWRLRLTHPISGESVELHSELPLELKNWLPDAPHRTQ